MRRFARYAVAFLLLFPLSLGFTVSCDPSAGDPFTDENLLTRQADQLSRSSVVAHPNVKIGQENLVCSGSFQLAWNELADQVGGPVKLAGDPSLARQLNEPWLTAMDLPDGSCVALAGREGDGIRERIRRQVRQAFGKGISPALPDPALTPRPQDIVAYGLIFRDLRFAHKFQETEGMLTWDGQAVESFGVRLAGEANPEVADQVRVLSYRDDSDFIVQLQAGNATDQIILARVEPAETLAETVLRALERVETSRDRTNGTAPQAEGSTSTDSSRLQPTDRLVIPKFSFLLTRSYDELVGRGLLNRKAGLAGDLRILQAVQQIRFQMNEEGVALRDESHVALGCSAQAPPVGRRLILDGPFLLMLRRGGGDRPYFVMWVANTELLVASPG